MQLKRIDPKELVYHYFEKSVSEFALFDDTLEMPVAYGSRNLVDSTVRSLHKGVTVLYYKRDSSDRVSFKKKAIFKGNSKSTITNTPNDLTQKK